MKKLFIFLGIICFTNSVRAQEYFVAFFGENINLPSSPVGHAFIGIGKGTPLTCDINGEETEMWGFYPRVKIEGGKSYWSGPVDAEVKNDVRTHIDQYYSKRISFSDYIKVNLKIEEWKKKQYQVTRQDCISFFIDIATLFTDINLPDRTTFTLPEAYVKKFIELNK